jgi:galacturonokinase
MAPDTGVLPLENRVKALALQVATTFDMPVDRVRVCRSPYRVCPLGAHVDHQGGLVTGMALDRSVLFAFVPSTEPMVRVRSTDFDGETTFSLDAIPPKRRSMDWGDYLRGAAVALAGFHPLTQGLQGIIQGEMPEGGLSSSAAVGVAYLLGLASANGIALGIPEAIELDMRIEHDYIGIRNGILDQTAILASRKDHLLLIDCHHTQIETVALPDQPRPYGIGLFYSGLTAPLTNTGYNHRVGECHAAAAALLRIAGLPVPKDPVLRDVPVEVFEACAQELPEPLGLRAAHFFSEQQRVIEGVSAWKHSDWEMFGRLIRESGNSSIHQYQCGCLPLVSLYHLLNECPGVHGARFSGAGFRGCCLAWCDPEAEREIAERVRAGYTERHSELADRFQLFYCQSDDGARLLD